MIHARAAAHNYRDLKVPGAPATSNARRLACISSEKQGVESMPTGVSG